MAKSKPQSVPQSYESNPFSLSFNSFSQLFKTNLGWGVALLVLSLIGFIWQAISNIIQLVASDSSRSHQAANHADTTANITGVSGVSDVNVAAVIMIVIGVIILVTLFVAACVAISTFISGMLSYVALRSEQGESVSFDQAASATAKRFWRLYFAQILAGLKIFGWTLLFIVPGIIASFRYALLPFVIMAAGDEERGVVASHTTTKALVKGRLMEIFGIATIGALVPVIGSILRLTGNAAFFTQLKEYQDKEKPRVHWLNYLGLILLGLIILFIVFITVLVLLIAAASK